MSGIQDWNRFVRIDLRPEWVTRQVASKKVVNIAVTLPWTGSTEYVSLGVGRGWGEGRTQACGRGRLACRQAADGGWTDLKEAGCGHVCLLKQNRLVQPSAHC